MIDRARIERRRQLGVATLAIIAVGAMVAATRATAPRPFPVQPYVPGVAGSPVATSLESFEAGDVFTLAGAADMRCHQAEILAPSTPERIVERRVGRLDLDATRRAGHNLVVLYDNKGIRLHAELVPRDPVDLASLDGHPVPCGRVLVVSDIGTIERLPAS